MLSATAIRVATGPLCELAPKPLGIHTNERNIFMSQTTTTSSKSDRAPEGARHATVGENVQEELMRLRDDLHRVAHDVRMKTKGAGAEIQDTRRMLEREAKRFSAEVEEAVDRTQADLLEAGKALRTRFEKLANKIAFPAN